MLSPRRLLSRPAKGLLLALALALPATSALAVTPTVSSVTGVFQGNADSSTTANVVTISGADFPVKSTAAPLIWATFEDSIQPTALGQITTWDGTENMEQSSSGEGMTGNYAAECTTAGFLTCTLSINETISANEMTYNYHNTKKTFTRADYSETNWKLCLRYWVTAGVQPDLVFSGSVATVEGISDPSGSWFLNSADDLIYAANTWNRDHETWFMASTINTADGSFYHSVQGVLQSSQPAIVTQETGDSLMADLFIFQYVKANPVTQWEPDLLIGDNHQVWGDDVYFDNTAARVMLSNNADISLATERHPMPAKSWNDTTDVIEVYWHTGQQSGTGYVHVCNDGAELDCSAGFQVTIGGSSIEIPEDMRINGSGPISGSITF